MSFVGLYTGLSGIRAAQTGIDTTSHNVANASTPGYTRQRVELSAAHSFQSPAGPIGTGVEVEQIARLRDGFLDDRYRAASGDHAAASTQADLLGRLEQLAGEPDHGISTRLARLWDAAETWSNDPADPVTRQQVLSELASVSDGFNTAAESWSSLEADSRDRLDTVTGLVNDRLDTLHDLNTKITGADVSRLGPELFDQRDLLLDELASLTGGEIRTDADGWADITVADQSLIPRDEASNGPYTIAVGADGNVTATPPEGSAETGPVDLAYVGGELGGLNTFLEKSLPDLRAELDQFAETFAGAVNGINTSGVHPDGSPVQEVLEFEAGDPAATLRLIDTDPARLAAAVDPNDGSTVGLHDGSNARQLADLRTTPVLAEGEDPADAATLESRLADHVTGLAAQVRTEQSNADAARSVYRSAELARASEHGVSIDEEMVGLVRYQRSLEASSRVMTTVDEALDVLVNRTGVVGR